MANPFKTGDTVQVSAYRATLLGKVDSVDGQWVRFTITAVSYWANGASEYKVGHRRTVDYRQCDTVSA